MAIEWIEQRRRYRQYRGRTESLPANYRATVEALERYLMHFGPADADGAASVFEQIIDLFEQGAAAATPVRDIVGEDPVEFVELLLRDHRKGRWIVQEQERLASGVNDAVRTERNDIVERISKAA